MLLGLRITEQLQNYERTNNVQLKSTSLYTLYIGLKTTGTFQKKHGIYIWADIAFICITSLATTCHFNTSIIHCRDCA